MPLRYTSELAEHRAVRGAAGVFDLSHMAELEVSGADAGAALDYALVGRLAELPVGGARYTMACDESGGVVDDLVVYRREAERYLVVANASNAATMHALLVQRAAGYSAEVVDATDRYGLVAIQGPLALEVLQPFAEPTIAGLRSYQATEGTVLGAPALLARTGYTGEDGFELFVPAERAAEVFETLLDAGAARGVVPSGLAARDSLRLEAGMPLYGNELSREVTPYEANLSRVVRLDKPGDFIGRDALVERQADGPRARLVGLVGEGRRAARHGYSVHAGTGEKVVGTVTSGALSPTLGRPVAMAYVDLEHAEPGSQLVVDVRGREEPAEVTKLPFYRRTS
ncbi:MAG: glycine cleavage system protein [Acidimicrobiaceae bacterium]|nr:glycine cleavage system protein [Acidimicrobiaceae bacterium]